MDEELLADHPARPIVRIGDSVHRPAHAWTPAVHGLLRHLEAVGFPYTPRVRGFDGDGREVLSFLPGEAGMKSWVKITTDAGLRRFARLLRLYHDAVADYRPDAGSRWAYAEGGVVSGEIVCHGDFGPWNTVWDGDTPVGIVDWDMAAPAPARDDILYALEYAAPFRDDATALKWHHFSEAPDRKRRIEIFAEAYGLRHIPDVAAGVAAQQRRVAGYMAQLAAREIQPQKDWVAAGALDDAERQALWTEAHRPLFEGTEEAAGVDPATRRTTAHAS